MLELALIGDFQCGKSTAFNAMCGGRVLSPPGRGVKTSACAITARALQAEGAREHAEWQWRSPEELRQFADSVLAQLEADFPDDPSLRRSALLIRRFCDTPEIARWRRRTRMAIDDAQKLLVYPEDWETRWLGDPKGNSFKLNEVLFLFARRVVFNVRSEALKSLGWEITDSPGFDAGLWDVTLAREVMLRADGILCIVNGAKGTITQQYLGCLEWIARFGMAPKVCYAMNVWKSRRTVEMDWRTVNMATLRQRGLPVADEGMKGFNAWLAFASSSISFKRNTPMYGLKSRFQRMLNAVLRVMGREVADDAFESKTANSLAEYSGMSNVEELRATVGDPMRLWALSGFNELLDELRAFRTVREKFGRVLSEHPGIEVSDGLLKPQPGYAWKDNSSFVSQVSRGVVWRPGMGHTDIANIVAQNMEGTWRPLVGYFWKDTGSDDLRNGKLTAVEWRPGCQHRTVPNVIASDEEGEWCPAKGYDWIDPSTLESRLARGVRWRPGLEYGDGRHLVSGGTEGRWLPSPKRARDEIVTVFKKVSCPRLYVGGVASEKKIRNARKDMGIPPEEKIVVQFDDTVFRGGGDGFAVTCGGIYAKSLWEVPIHRRWDEINRAAVEEGKFHLNTKTIALGKIQGSDLIDGLNRAFGQILC